MSAQKLDISISPRQKMFIDSDADEVLFGGAAGGGKSYGQLVDAMLFALKYPKSQQLILRRTFPELEKSLIRTSLEIFPKEIYKYNSSSHCGTFKNGSIIDFSYCDNENDVNRYQSAQYDVIRFDELTHFTQYMYEYLLSRIRGANDYPKQMKSSTNPGGVGHTWVKERFIDIGEPDVVHKFENGSRMFIPSKIQDNTFLLSKDPGYLKRLENLNEKDKRALLYGDWDIFDGQYFAEFDRSIHVVNPFQIPRTWRKYFAMDYGMDMLAGYWIAVDECGNAYVYREVYQPGLIISIAAQHIRDMDDEGVYTYFAPPDLWNRRQDTGKSAAEIFWENGVPVVKAKNDRMMGWMALHEWLQPQLNEFGATVPRLRIFSNCTELIRTLPAVLVDKKNPNDVAKEPHELTHAPDAIRYFVAGRPLNADAAEEEKDEDSVTYDDEVDSFINFGV